MTVKLLFLTGLVLAASGVLSPHLASESISAGEFARAGKPGHTAVSIGLALGLGILLGWALRVKSKTSLLISIGTAICGGSAIAAIAPITQPDDDDWRSLWELFLP